MKYVTDTHMHTIESGHAYSTINEYVIYARKKGIELIAITDHAYGNCMSDNMLSESYFLSLAVVPRKVDDVYILRGAEVNIINENGDVDLSKRTLDGLDYVIASLHEFAMLPLNKEGNTNAYLNVMENENIVALGHIGNPSFEIDIEKVVKKAKEKNVLIEINNSSLNGQSRPGSYENCKRVLEVCKENKNKVVLSSDSHICYNVGNFETASRLIKEIDFPEELILSTSSKKLLDHLKLKGKIKENFFEEN